MKKKESRPAPPATTSSGIPILGSYGEPDPGEFPFTRGISVEMYRERYWTMRQYAGFGSARDSNRRYRYLLEQGQTGLSIAFDLPTQMGYDSDDPMARGEVGKAGVAIATIEDMRILTEDLPLESVSISMTINSTAAILLALLLAVARERGIAWEKLSGTVQNDLLKEYVARGTYIFPPRPSLKLTTDIFEFCGSQVPRSRAVWRSMGSPRGFLSSSTPTRTSSRRSRSSVRRAGSGPRSRAGVSARRIPAPGGCASTRKRRARLSRRSRRTSMPYGWRFRRSPRSWEERSRFTPTPRTRLWRFRRNPQRGWRCARSR